MSNLEHLLGENVSPVRENNVEAFEVAASIPRAANLIHNLEKEMQGFLQLPEPTQLNIVLEKMEFTARMLEQYAETLRNGKPSKICPNCKRKGNQ